MGSGARQPRSSSWSASWPRLPGGWGRRRTRARPRRPTMPTQACRATGGGVALAVGSRDVQGGRAAAAAVAGAGGRGGRRRHPLAAVPRAALLFRRPPRATPQAGAGRARRGPDRAEEERAGRPRKTDGRPQRARRHTLHPAPPPPSFHHGRAARRVPGHRRRAHDGRGRAHPKRGGRRGGRQHRQIVPRPRRPRQGDCGVEWGGGEGWREAREAAAIRPRPPHRPPLSARPASFLRCSSTTSGT